MSAGKGGFLIKGGEKKKKAKRKRVSKGRGRSLHSELLFLPALQPRRFAGPCEFKPCV